MHLLNPMQMRDQGVIVNDVPLQQLQPQQRTLDSHAIVADTALDDDSTVRVPVTLRGNMSGFIVRKPTWEEVHNREKAIEVHMTSHAEWDPNKGSFAEIEQALQDDLHRDFHLERHIGMMWPRRQEQ